MKFKLIPLFIFAAVTSSYAQKLKFVDDIERTYPVSDAYLYYTTLPNGELSIFTLSKHHYPKITMAHSIITKKNKLLYLPEVTYNYGEISSETFGAYKTQPDVNSSFSDKNTIYQLSITKNNNLQLLKFDLSQPDSYDSVVSANKITQAITSVQKDLSKLKAFNIENVKPYPDGVLLYANAIILYGTKNHLQEGYYRYALVFNYASKLVSAVSPESLNPAGDCHFLNPIGMSDNNFISGGYTLRKDETGKEIRSIEWSIAQYNIDTKESESSKLITKTTTPIIDAQKKLFSKSLCPVSGDLVLDEPRDAIYTYALCYGSTDDDPISVLVQKFNFAGDEIWKQKIQINDRDITKKQHKFGGTRLSARILRDGNLSLNISIYMTLPVSEPFDGAAKGINSSDNTWYSSFNFDAESGLTYPNKEVDRSVLQAIEDLMKQDKTLTFFDEEKPDKSIREVGKGDYFIILKSKKNNVYKIYRYR